MHTLVNVARSDTCLPRRCFEAVRTPSRAEYPIAGGSGVLFHSSELEHNVIVTYLREVTYSLVGHLSERLMHPIRTEQFSESFGLVLGLCEMLIALDKEFEVFLEERDGWMKLKTVRAPREVGCTYIGSPAPPAHTGLGSLANLLETQGRLCSSCVR